MDNNQRQLYNKNYYEANKKKILDKALIKIRCDFCNRSVIKYNINKHQQSDICIRKSQEIIDHQHRLIQHNILLNNVL